MIVNQSVDQLIIQIKIFNVAGITGVITKSTIAKSIGGYWIVTAKCLELVEQVFSLWQKSVKEADD